MSLYSLVTLLMVASRKWLQARCLWTTFLVDQPNFSFKLPNRKLRSCDPRWVRDHLQHWTVCPLPPQLSR